MSRRAFTRTINPLQFDALEPKRFEDLVRQLLYDFRNWQQLEPTGRSGSDDGFDVRGWEARGVNVADETDAIDEINEALGRDVGKPRLWLIQCKREREIGPSKLKGYLNTIADPEKLDGLIFVASADFSKKAIDEFRAWCVGKGVSEFHLWGKANLEDMLFLPKNDHLLFAYFGLSLAIRRRSEQSRLRSQTTIKRKLQRALVEKTHVLLRDLSDNRYPVGNSSDRGWWVFSNARLSHRGLECQRDRFFAYIDDQGEHWDFSNGYQSGGAGTHFDPWTEDSRVDHDAHRQAFEFWENLPALNKAWLEVRGIIPFDSIVEVDEIGDEITPNPHVYIYSSEGLVRPFAYLRAEITLENQWIGGSVHNPARELRIDHFPGHLRKEMPQPPTGSIDDEVPSQSVPGRV